MRKMGDVLPVAPTRKQDATRTFTLPLSRASGARKALAGTARPRPALRKAPCYARRSLSELGKDQEARGAKQHDQRRAPHANDSARVARRLQPPVEAAADPGHQPVQ